MNKKLKLIIETVLEKYFYTNLLSTQSRTRIADDIINIKTHISASNINEELLSKLVTKETL